MIKVSIIIPIYNAEVYIQKCIESVENQTMKELEIICIDDGSIDTTLQVLYGLQKKDGRIRILKQSHAGSGAARNYGISKAKGSYISFLDVDDFYYDKNALQYMVNACEKNHVNICGSFLKVIDENGIQDYSLFPDIDIKEIQGKLVDFKEFQEDFHYQCFIFNRLFLLENQIDFPHYLRYQDPPFFLKALLKARCFWVLPVTLYCYRFGHQNKERNARKIEYVLMGIKDNLQMAVDNDLRILYKKIIGRIENEYYEDILYNLSDNVMRLLLEIREINDRYKGADEFKILNDIYGLCKNAEKIPIDVPCEEVSNLKKSYGLMKNIIRIQQSAYGFRQYFFDRKIKKVAVYGVGEYGKILLNILKECGIDIVCCIDRQVLSYKQVRIIKPEDDIPQCDCLIISLLDCASVLRMYQERNIKNVITFRDIIVDIIVDISK